MVVEAVAAQAGAEVSPVGRTRTAPAMGAMPDIRVLRTPEDEAQGRDRQLEVAVEELGKQIQSDKTDG